jgi:hypothetical protein
MTPVEMTARLLTLGFTHGDQYADLGLCREWLVYLKRVHEGQYQCLWLTTYDDRFIESILYVYAKPFNSRARPPMVPLHCMIYRTMEEIEVAAGKVYETVKSTTP